MKIMFRVMLVLIASAYSLSAKTYECKFYDITNHDSNTTNFIYDDEVSIFLMTDENKLTAIIAGKTMKTKFIKHDLTSDKSKYDLYANKQFLVIAVYQDFNGGVRIMNGEITTDIIDCKIISE